MFLFVGGITDIGDQSYSYYYIGVYMFSLRPGGGGDLAVVSLLLVYRLE